MLANEQQSSPPSLPPTVTLTHQERLLGYTEESKVHFKRSRYLHKYMSRKATASQTSARTYATYLAAFAFYIFKEKGQEVDAFIESIKTGKDDPYDILAEFASFLQESRSGMHALGANHLIQMVKTARKCLRMSGVNINNEDFREFVSLPKKVRKQKTPIDKLTVSKLLNSCKDVQLSTAVLFHAVLGPRPIEAFAVRNMDLDLGSDVAKVTFRAEYSKIRLQLTRNPEDYAVNNPNKKIGTLLGARAGEVIAYFKTDDKKEIASVKPEDIGIAKYKQMLKTALQDALEIMGYGMAEEIESEIFGLTRKPKRKRSPKRQDP